MQGDWGGVARKPTALGTNLFLEMPDPEVRGGLARGQGEEMDSKELARWAPGMMREVTKSLTMIVRARRWRSARSSAGRTTSRTVTFHSDGIALSVRGLQLA